MSGDRHADDIEEQPLLRAMSQATGRVMDAKLADHERRLHDGDGVDRTPPGPRHEPITAVPWAKLRIADEVLAQVTEDLEADPELTLEEVAWRYEQPLSLLTRELAAYWQAHRKWALLRALQVGSGV